MSAAYMAVISGERRDPLAFLARGVLRMASWPYRVAIGLRNDYFNRIALVTYLDAPVISVGNLTVGGTGKTPMTIWLCRQLLDGGRKPAVLSRGYKSGGDGQADEIMLVSRHCPRAVAIAHADRARSGQMAIAEYGADTIVLDDGFQHRRVYRDLDIVLIDATRPFGFGHVLPRGLLREPVRSLSRAGAVVITRSDRVDEGVLECLERTIRKHNGTVPIFHAVHGPSGFANLQGEPVPHPPGSRIGAFCGIARPEAFFDTLATVGCTAQDRVFWPDHHAYGDEDVRVLTNWVRDQRLDALVTTEKDAVKLARLEVDWPVPITVLRIDIGFVNDGADRLLDLIAGTLRDFEVHDEHAEQTDPDEPAAD